MKPPRQMRGQGLVEYAALLVLVAVVVIVVLILLGPNIGNVFSNIAASLEQPTALASGPTPTGTLTPTEGPPPTDTEPPPATDTNPPPGPTDTSAPTETEDPYEAGETETPTPTPTHTATSAPVLTATPTQTSSPPATPTVTLTHTPTPGVLFADGFESGGLSEWSSSATDGGDLSVSASAALVGGQGMQIAIDDNNDVFVQDDTPDGATRYRARFYFDPNSIPMSNGNEFYLLIGYLGTSTEVLRVEMQRSGGNYQLRGRLRNDGSSWTSTNWFTISDDAHVIEVDWRAASGPGASDGGLTLWIDNAEQQDVTGVDNDTRQIDSVRVGAVDGVDSGTRGTVYFDAFESRTDSYIGPA